MSTAAEFVPSSVLGGFRVEALLGRGGMGLVYRATQLSLGRPVALKVIRPELAGEQRFRERFLREARLAASIEHPHLLPVYEVGEADGTLFLALRLVDGTSLADLLRGVGRLAPERAVRLCSQLAAALGAAHEAGLVHRDVKPQNVLVSGAGEAEHAYLCDFGLSRRMDGGALTSEGGFAGTAAYAAPEQIRGEPLDGRTDLYALGCVLYECLTGEPPFVHEDELALCWAHLHEAVASAGAVEPDLARFDPVFVRALAKDRAARFGSGGELARIAQDALASGSPAETSSALPLPAPELPRPLTSFLGRERELQHLVALLVDGGVRLLTLTGPGGTGKTRLALRTAEEAAAAFGDGVVWVGLASLRDQALVVATIAHALEAKRELAEEIGDRRLLLLLDNFEQVVDAAPELTMLLERCPNLSLLVTSREVLRVQAEVEYAVPPLDEQEALELFCVRARLEPSREIAELCLRLDNLPLAVELAAARTTVLSPAQIFDRLSQRLDLLKGGRDADPRQRTLRATIEWSYDLLAAEERRTLERLSVFAGSFPIDAAEDVCDVDIDVLSSLVDKSLVRRAADGRFFLLQTIREYALERLAASGESGELRRRHALFFAGLMTRLEPRLRTADAEAELERLRREIDDLRAALDHLEVSEDADSHARLAGSSWYFWYLTGQFVEARRRLERAAARKHGVPLLTRATVLDGLSVTALLTGGAEEGRESAEESLRIRRAEGDEEGLLRSLLNLACAAELLGDVAEAIELYGECSALAQKVGDPWFRVVALGNLGSILLSTGDAAGAREKLAQAVDAAERQGDPYTASATRINLAAATLELGDVEDACDTLVDILDRSRASPELVLWCLVWLAAAASSTGEPERAGLILGACDRLSAAIGYELPPMERGRYDRTKAELESALGIEAFAAARERGAALDQDEAVAFALERG